MFCEHQRQSALDNLWEIYQTENITVKIREVIPKDGPSSSAEYLDMDWGEQRGIY